VLITVADADKKNIINVAKEFAKLGFKIKSTDGTHRQLGQNGVKSDMLLKMHEGRPNVMDCIKNGEVQLIVNTPAGKMSKYDDSYIRKAAIKYKIPYMTTTAAAAAAAKGIAAFNRAGSATVKALQQYHAAIR
jgi:carbamoyl-phosphate synthase large subunit